MTRGRSVITLTTLLLAGGLVVGPGGATAPAQAASASPAAAAGGECVGSDDPTATSEAPTTDPSASLLALQVPQAQELVRLLSGREPGEGVQVAVVDSGVREQIGTVREVAQDVLTDFTMKTTHESSQGTEVAAIIAGASRADGPPPEGQRDDLVIGVAPAATIYDMRVYDAPDGDDVAPAESAGVAEGLRRLVPLIGPRGIRIINVSLDVTRSDALDAAVAAVTQAGAIVVAAAGDRAATDDPADAYQLGEDRADQVWPAGYAHGDAEREANSRVVAVTTTAVDDLDDATSYMVQSSAIEVAVPTYGAVSYGLNGVACSFSRPSTVVAAAQVSGILALLYTVYPRDSPDQIVARLLDTATGGGVIDADHPDLRVGHGIVQPLEALNRALAPARDGSIDRSVRPEERAEPAALPAPEPDLLAGTRRDAVWWGLLGGGALLLAVLLRPVLSRRRSAARG